MKREDAIKIKCDRCGETCGLYQHSFRKWRCPACIWKERGQLIDTLQRIWYDNSDIGIKYGIGTLLIKLTHED